jgi:hypothetical protein
MDVWKNRSNFIIGIMIDPKFFITYPILDFVHRRV